MSVDGVLMDACIYLKTTYSGVHLDLLNCLPSQCITSIKICATIMEQRLIESADRCFQSTTTVVQQLRERIKKRRVFLFIIGSSRHCSYPSSEYRLFP